MANQPTQLFSPFFSVLWNAFVKTYRQLTNFRSSNFCVVGWLFRHSKIILKLG
jgi:hypothetical protein